MVLQIGGRMKVESGVPIPVRFPFADMKVGDSFSVPATTKRSTVNVSAKRYGDKHGQKFTVRIMPDRTLRCWRIA